jgi:hypothetical protein
MVSVLASSLSGHVLEPRSDQTKDYEIGICCFAAKHAVLRRKSKNRLTRNQNNVSEWSDMFTHGLLFQWASTIQIQLSVLVQCKADLIIILLKIMILLKNCKISIKQQSLISQLICYARTSSNYSDFLKRHLHLRNRLLDQGYEQIRLILSLKKYIFRYQDLVGIYSVSAEKNINDGFSNSENE